MKEAQAELNLDQGEAHLLRDLVPGRALYVMSGMAWVTQEGDSRDYLLGPGGLFRVLKHGRVVVEALKRSKVLVTSIRYIERLESVKAARTA
jgi:hypothetical protein